tara:strand:- start:20878 stop:21906 length:1029 start_codon:yes stop_codon:yes gene_type:complete
MKFFICILLFPLLSIGQFYKYATIYGGASINAVAPAVSNYEYINNQLIETTSENGYNYRYQIGIKKISRYKFEKKPKFYYDGTEKNASLFRSAIDKLEYVIQYEKIKDRGLEYKNYDFWLRYVAENYVAKIQQSDNGFVDLSYKACDIRLKRDFKDLRATIGFVLRNYPIYNTNAFKIDFPNYNDFNTTINELGYYSESGFVDDNNNGYMDRWEEGYTIWINEAGDSVAGSTGQMQEIYADLVGQYNRDWRETQGNQNTLSSVLGISYYKYLDNFFILIYGNYFLYNYGLTEYATTTNDYDFGLITNLKVTRWISLYSQLNYLKYFGRENYTINFGINLIII